MSTSSPTPPSSSQPTSITLPPGVTLGVGRETSQPGPNNTIVQGVLYPVTLASGTTTSVFVPYSMIANLGMVQGLFDARIAALSAIGG